MHPDALARRFPGFDLSVRSMPGRTQSNGDIAAQNSDRARTNDDCSRVNARYHATDVTFDRPTAMLRQCGDRKLPSPFDGGIQCPNPMRFAIPRRSVLASPKKHRAPTFRPDGNSRCRANNHGSCGHCHGSAPGSWRDLQCTGNRSVHASSILRTIPAAEQMPPAGLCWLRCLRERIPGRNRPRCRETSISMPGWRLRHPLRAAFSTAERRAACLLIRNVAHRMSHVPFQPSSYPPDLDDR